MSSLPMGYLSGTRRWGKSARQLTPTESLLRPLSPFRLSGLRCCILFLSSQKSHAILKPVGAGLVFTYRLEFGRSYPFFSPLAFVILVIVIPPVICL